MRGCDAKAVGQLINAIMQANDGLNLMVRVRGAFLVFSGFSNILTILIFYKQAVPTNRSTQCNLQFPSSTQQVPACLGQALPNGHPAELSICSARQFTNSTRTRIRVELVVQVKSTSRTRHVRVWKDMKGCKQNRNDPAALDLEVVYGGILMCQLLWATCSR